MALGNYSPYYKCPQEIEHMKKDLSFLPYWYSPEDSLVRIYNKNHIPVFSIQTSSFNKILAERFVDTNVSAEVIPWGWDPSIVHSLKSGNQLSYILPEKEMMDKIRYLSSRERTVEVLESLSCFDGLCGEAFCCTDIFQVMSILEKYGHIILKSPWSGSGRGLVRISVETWTDNIKGWVSRIIRTQGSIMAEPIYNKILDFAMEFCSDKEGDVSFVGYSLFDTDSHGNYKHNILMNDTRIEEHITKYIPIDVLREVKDNLLRKLKDFIDGNYTGYFGIDMMICLENGNYLLHPCVEINLRMNMGIVSHIIFNRFVNYNSSGIFVVEYYSSEGEALAAHENLTSQYPLVKDESGKITGGYLSLTPVVLSTHYQAYILVK